MELKVTIKYRDDTEKVYWCIDYPSISDWITIYLPNLKRILIPKEAVAEIIYEVARK